jgi:hydroxymethylglutaryl-CoA lyase
VISQKFHPDANFFLGTFVGMPDSTFQSPLFLTECPRDAMQGLAGHVDTSSKVDYLNALLKVGFDVLDFGSFVSPHAMPQMADTSKVVERLEESSTELLAIVANLRGAQEALQFPRIDRVGFPFSISETFQQRNTGASIDEGLLRIENMVEQTARANRGLTVYLSMGFGNPYGETWHEDLLCKAVERLYESLGVTRVALSDTVAVGTPEQIERAFELLVPSFPAVEIGGHMHVVKGKERPVLEALYSGGCRHIDGALGGYGGCPMAQNELVGNLATEALLDFTAEHEPQRKFDSEAWSEAQKLASEIFI